MKCDHCGGPIGGEIVESFFVDGSYCSEACAKAAEEDAE